MAFTVEDGTGLSGSNAYVSVAAFKTYSDDRGRSWVSFTDAQIQQSLVRASDYADIRWRFRGIRLVTSQSMEFPRSGAYYDDGEPITGVPDEIAEAASEYAWIDLNGTTLSPNPSYDATNQDLVSISQRVGDIGESKTFASGGLSRISFREYPSADHRLRGLIVNTLTMQRA